MKKTILLCVIIFIFFACDDGLDNVQDKPKSLTESARTSAGGYLYDENTDASGTVHVEVWSSPVHFGYQNTATISLNSDLVLVGGGASIDNQTYLGYGALLTESRPDFPNNSWVVSSKDHINASYHGLWAYAIGIKIDGVSASDLRNRMVVVTNTSSVSSTPSSNATLPNGYTLIGGGAKVNWSGYGNLLVGSYPTGPNTWFASSKDHKRSSPASITSYAIGIQNGAIPNFGTLSIAIESTNSVSVPAGSQSTSGQVSAGRIGTCSGALSTYNSYGRMLIGMNVGDYYGASSKDHINSDAGTIRAWAITVKKQ